MFETFRRPILAAFSGDPLMVYCKLSASVHSCGEQNSCPQRAVESKAAAGCRTPKEV